MSRYKASLLSVVGIAALAVGGCGSSSKPSASTTSSSSQESSPYGSGETSSSSTTAAGASGAGAATVITVKQNGRLGRILAAGPKQQTVYLFAADKGSTSSCSGACAQVWPPVTTSGAPSAQGGAIAADLRTITRSDGTKQVTYKGQPLYYYAADRTSASAYGQALSSFGAAWYVLAPSGSEIQ